MTGDVFAGVDIPGCEAVAGDHEKLAIVVSHPCSMRQGHVLNERLQVVRVTRSDEIPLSMWPKGHYDKMPLPGLTDSSETEEDDATDEGTGEFHAALLDLRGRVETAQLRLDERVACLSEEGVAFLHQRMGHNDTRHAPSVEDLMAACAPVFREADLAERWCEDLLPPEAVDDLIALPAGSPRWPRSSKKSSPESGPSQVSRVASTRCGRI